MRKGSSSHHHKSYMIEDFAKNAPRKSGFDWVIFTNGTVVRVDHTCECMVHKPHFPGFDNEQVRGFYRAQLYNSNYYDAASLLLEENAMEYDDTTSRCPQWVDSIQRAYACLMYSGFLWDNSGISDGDVGVWAIPIPRAGPCIYVITSCKSSAMSRIQRDWISPRCRALVDQNGKLHWL